jgi:hypothetical protein
MLQLIIEQELPFSVVESLTLRRLTGVCVSRQTISTYAQTARGEVMQRVIRILSQCQFIVLTFDEWSDKNLVKYLGVKVLTLSDSGVYRAYSLSHFPLEDEPDALHLSRTIVKILKSFEIRDAGKVTYAVTDTTAVMPKTVSNLGLTHLPCWCHVLNLMLGDILGELKSDDKDKSAKPLDPLFTAVRSVKKSQKFLRLIRDANYQSIPTYCPCRWYSLWKLLRNSISLRHELNAFLTKKKLDPISDDAWDLAENLLYVVSTFRNSTEKLESDSFGSISYVLLIRHLLTMIVDERKCNEIGRGWKSASQRWNRSLSGEVREIVLMAAFLNPSMDLNTVMTTEERSDLNICVEEKIKKLKRAESGGSQDPEPRKDRSIRSPERGMTPDDIRPQREAQYNELAGYISARRNAVIDSGDQLLDWWHVNRPLFPTLFKLAMEILSIPASSAASERQFSRAKRISSDRRKSLKPNKLQALVFLGENIEITQEVLRGDRYD